MASNGGLNAPLGVELIPTANLGGTGTFYWFNTANFNDPNLVRTYTYKAEDVLAGRVPEVSRVIVTYRDLGVATITLTLSGTDDNQAPQSNSITLTIGTIAASKKLCTVVVGLLLAANNLQLTISQLANAGPMSVTKVRMEGRVDRTAYS